MGSSDSEHGLRPGDPHVSTGGDHDSRHADRHQHAEFMGPMEDFVPYVQRGDDGSGDYFPLRPQGDEETGEPE